MIIYMFYICFHQSHACNLSMLNDDKEQQMEPTRVIMSDYLDNSS